MAPKRRRRFIEIRDAAKGVGHIDRSWQFVENLAGRALTEIHLAGGSEDNLGTRFGIWL